MVVGFSISCSISSKLHSETVFFHYAIKVLCQHRTLVLLKFSCAHYQYASQHAMHIQWDFIIDLNIWDTIFLVLLPSDRFSIYNKLCVLVNAHIALPYKRIGRICLSKMLRASLTETLRFLLMACSIIWATRDALAALSFMRLCTFPLLLIWKF